MKFNVKWFYIPFLVIVVSACSSIVTNLKFYEPVLNSLEKSDFNTAVKKIEEAEANEEYSEKDRLLLYLDKGILYHYQGNYKESNAELEKAERTIEELFTKSISKGASSLLLNDNALDYSGEDYENIYINIFKALNYLQLGKPDDAYVEVNRVNIKLRELDTKYEKLYGMLSEEGKDSVDIEPEKLGYYNNVMANYLSALIYRADNEQDNARISMDNLYKATEQHPDIYNFPMPKAVEEFSFNEGTTLNIFAFAGPGPQKSPVGARITTFNNYILVSDPTDFYLQPIPFPGVKGGYNFKFVFPELKEIGTYVNHIDVYVNGKIVGEMEMLENMYNVAEKTFKQNKGMIFFKTALRAVTKGLSTGILAKNLDKNSGLGGFASFLASVAVEVTEQADLRNWRTMPSYAFTSEIPLEPGKYDVELRYIGDKGNMLYKKEVKNFTVKRGLNVMESFYLN